MSQEQISREPITISVDGRPFHFYCRLFDDQPFTRAIFRQVAAEADGAAVSVLLLKEPNQPLPLGLLVFGPLRQDLLDIAPFIADHGEPYYSEFMTEAVHRREVMIAARQLGMIDDQDMRSPDLREPSLRNFKPKNLL